MMDLIEMINAQLEDEQKGIEEYSNLSSKLSEVIIDEDLRASAVAGIEKLKTDEESHFAYLTLLKAILTEGAE